MGLIKGSLFATEKSGQWPPAVDLIVRTKFNYRTEGKNLKDISKQTTLGKIKWLKDYVAYFKRLLIICSFQRCTYHLLNRYFIGQIKTSQAMGKEKSQKKKNSGEIFSTNDLYYILMCIIAECVLKVLEMCLNQSKIGYDMGVTRSL